MEFKTFLVVEQKEYLADRVNNVLTGVHELLSAQKQMGAKQMVKNAESIANQIRKILHASWPRSEHKYLKVLQRCGIALMKAIDDKGDLPEVFNSVRAELEKLSHKFRVPTNKLGTGEEETPKRPESPPPGEKQAVPATPPEATPQAIPGGIPS